MPQQDSGPVDNKRFYDLLGIDSSASENDIKKAWRKTALALHPDRGGDTEKFQEAQRAYEILSDPEKRQRYDRFGEKAFEGGDAGGGGHGDMDDVLRAFFGGGGGSGGGRRGPPRGKDVGMKVEVTLTELYCGAERTVDWERKGLCKPCDGNGGPPDAKSVCSTCDGNGIVIRVMRIGPMVQQQQGPCPDCRGQGYRMKESLMCKVCRGQGLIDEKVQLKYTIDPGMTNGEKIKLSQEGDRLSKDMIPGDVYMVLELVKDDDDEASKFERKGVDHLLYKKKISLLEALTGYQFVITHLDGRKLRVASPSTLDNTTHQVVKPGDLKLISREGMPSLRNPLVKGNLVIQFEVEFPMFLNLSSKHKGFVDRSDFETLHKFLPLGENLHPNFKDWVSEDEKKAISDKSTAKTSSAKKRKKKKKQSSAVAAPEESTDESDSHPIDVTFEDISADLFNRMKESSSRGSQHNARSHQRATEDDDDDGESGGAQQCRVQ